jgi:hypothetical protein
MSFARKSPVDATKLNRSRLTNSRALLPGIDMRSAEGRRFRDLVIEYKSQFDDRELSEPELVLIRQCAWLSLRSERAQCQQLQGKPVTNEDESTRLTNALLRAMRELREMQRLKNNEPPSKSAIRQLENITRARVTARNNVARGERAEANRKGEQPSALRGLQEIAASLKGSGA